MLIIGQSLECWRPPLADAVARRDGTRIVRRARRQIEAGAGALDVNFGAAGRPDDLAWAAQLLRTELPGVPLFLDSGNLEALAVAVGVTPGPVVVNAAPIEAAASREVRRLLESAADVHAGVVFSPRAADRNREAAAILEAAGAAHELVVRASVSGPVYLDCLTYSPASDLERCRRSLGWLQALRDGQAPQVEPLIAAGNLGHGSTREQREALQLVYVAIAAAFGVGAVIMPVEDEWLMSLVSSLEGRSSPGTDFERWATALQRSREAIVPPPGVAERAAWELLWPG